MCVSPLWIPLEGFFRGACYAHALYRICSSVLPYDVFPIWYKECLFLHQMDQAMDTITEKSIFPA